MSDFNNNWIEQYIPNRDTYNIFDIGAHNFEDSIRFSRVDSRYKVYGIEADPKNFERYSRGAMNNGVNAVNCAFSDKDGDSLFFSSDKLNGVEWTPSGSLLKPTDLLKQRISFSDGVKVETKRMDTFCKERGIQHVDIIHMDVQGAEHMVLKGFGSLRPDIIYCETCEYPNYEGSESLEYLLNLLDGMGYKVAEQLTYDTLFILK